jgi:hypothetical protein
LAKNIKFVAEALAKYIYGTDVQTNIFEGSLAVDTQFINAWLETLASYPRMFPFTEKNHTVIAGLERTLSQYTTDVSRQTFTLATSSDEIAFYDSTSGQMTAYKSKPFYFDMFISVGVLAYAAALYVLIRVRHNSHLYAYQYQRFYLGFWWCHERFVGLVRIRQS